MECEDSGRRRQLASGRAHPGSLELKRQVGPFDTNVTHILKTELALPKLGTTVDIKGGRGRATIEGEEEGQSGGGKGEGEKTGPTSRAREGIVGGDALLERASRRRGVTIWSKEGMDVQGCERRRRGEVGR